MAKKPSGDSSSNTAEKGTRRNPGGSPARATRTFRLAGLAVASRSLSYSYTSPGYSAVLSPSLTTGRCSTAALLAGGLEAEAHPGEFLFRVREIGSVRNGSQNLSPVVVERCL